jgi:tRNA (cytosine49-C5)-methyltransferase
VGKIIKTSLINYNMKTYEPKSLFVERMNDLLGEDSEKYWEILKDEPVKSLRVNTLKISVEDLKRRLEEKSWIVKQPFAKFPEIMIVEGKYARPGEDSHNNNLHKSVDANNYKSESSINNNRNIRAKRGEIIELEPGEIGRAIEHLLGYYYLQEISSMLPPLVLNPKPDEVILDLCAAPGSKTTQIAALMKNTGTIIANDLKLGRIKILASNLERCGVLNTIITKSSGEGICKRLKENNFKVDKILIDAPCSGEGTIRGTPKTLEMWNIKKVHSLSRIQKSLLSNAISLLEKEGGEIVYSTCTHSPEENEEVLDFILKKHKNVKIEKPSLPIEIKSREGIKKWQEKEYLEEVKYSCRIYPQDNNTEGFFISKLKVKKK